MAEVFLGLSEVRRSKTHSQIILPQRCQAPGRENDYTRRKTGGYLETGGGFNREPSAFKADDPTIRPPLRSKRLKCRTWIVTGKSKRRMCVLDIACTTDEGKPE